jgi:hypothetical protein
MTLLSARERTLHKLHHDDGVSSWPAIVIIAVTTWIPTPHWVYHRSMTVRLTEWRGDACQARILIAFPQFPLEDRQVRAELPEPQALAR